MVNNPSLDPMELKEIAAAAAFSGPGVRGVQDPEGKANQIGPESSIPLP